MSYIKYIDGYTRYQEKQAADHKRNVTAAHYKVIITVMIIFIYNNPIDANVQLCFVMDNIYERTTQLFSKCNNIYYRFGIKGQPGQISMGPAVTL